MGARKRLPLLKCIYMKKHTDYINNTYFCLSILVEDARVFIRI